uniref:CBS domain-containing protein n=1 Tax=Eutreptiella gymnastica TaxID=73025 RepID=A0A7S1NFK9_9EUGL
MMEPGIVTFEEVFNACSDPEFSLLMQLSRSGSRSSLVVPSTASVNDVMSRFKSVNCNALAVLDPSTDKAVGLVYLSDTQRYIQKTAFEALDSTRDSSVLSLEAIEPSPTVTDSQALAKRQPWPKSILARPVPLVSRRASDAAQEDPTEDTEMEEEDDMEEDVESQLRSQP